MSYETFKCRRSVESLHGVIEVEREEVPPNIVFVFVKQEEFNSVKLHIVDGVPRIVIDCEMFVRMNSLSDEIQEAVKNELREMKSFNINELHPDTAKELENLEAKFVD